MMQLEGAQLSIQEACAVAQVSRAGYYRYFDEHAPRQAETELRDRIQRVALGNHCYGYRRVAAELRLQGVVVNHKRVLRVMREDNLLSLRKRKFVVTTDSSHGRLAYPNLIAGLRLTVPNQVWVADITYIRLLEEFIFLAVLLDAFSRRALGWELGQSLQTSLWEPWTAPLRIDRFPPGSFTTPTRASNMRRQTMWSGCRTSVSKSA
jgi:transposase InsO family protein